MEWFSGVGPCAAEPDLSDHSKTGDWTSDFEDTFNFHCSQLKRHHAEQVDLQSGQAMQIAYLQQENANLVREVARLQAGAPKHFAELQTTVEPHAACEMATGARWARLAKAVWHSREAQTRLELARSQQERQGASTGCDRVREALQLISGTHGACEAVQAHELVYGNPSQGREPTAIWKAAAAALRNNVTMRVSCQQRSCAFSSFVAGMEQIYGPGRVGNQGYDLDLRSQLFNSYENIFPGFRCTRKRKRTRVRKAVDQHVGDGIVADVTMQQMDTGEGVGEAGATGEGSYLCDREEAAGMQRQFDEPGRRDLVCVVHNSFLHFKHSDSEDDRSQGRGSSKSCPAYSTSLSMQTPDDGSGSTFLKRLQAEMPTVAEEGQTPQEALRAFARKSAADGNSEQLQNILETLLTMSGDNAVSTMRSVLEELKQSKALVDCCAALRRFGGGQGGRAQRNEIVALLLTSLEKASGDEELRTACLDAILYICRDHLGGLEVLGLPGGRAPEAVGFNDELRSRIDKVIQPLAQCNGPEAKFAIQILARALPLDRVIHAIGPNGWLMDCALSEVFYTVESAIWLSYDEDGVESDKEWACKLLSDLSKQRQMVSHSHSQLAWIRAAHTRDKKINRCVMLGCLFPPAMLVHIFQLAVDSLDEDLMGILSMALQTINDNLESLPRDLCDELAHLTLTVDQTPLYRVSRSDLINMLGSIMRGRDDDLFHQVLKQVTRCANKFMSDRYGISFDHSVMWCLEGFVEMPSSWVSLKNNDKLDITTICSGYVHKWSEYKEPEALNVVKLAQKILAKA